MDLVTKQEKHDKPNDLYIALSPCLLKKKTLKWVQKKVRKQMHLIAIQTRRLATNGKQPSQMGVHLMKARIRNGHISNRNRRGRKLLRL
jgi:hypothetical protein